MPREENAIEEELQARGLSAPRLKPEDIDALIALEQYYVFPGTTVTVCCLTLRNGYNTVGTSASVSAANFDAEMGKRISRTNARDKIWELQGYLLKEVLSHRPKD